MSNSIPDKSAVLEALLEQIRADLAALTESQRASQDAATHAESRAEHSKDTRSLESSYLARGLAARVVELERALVVASGLKLEDFDAESAVAASALVGLEEDETGDVGHYFLVPVAGGIRLVVEGREIQTLTPAAPLGRAIFGRRVDDEVELQAPHGTRRFVVKSVS